jgi:hypothetical protein
MSLFATEVPVSPALTTKRFTAEVIAWLRGIRDSTVLDQATERDLQGDAPFLKTPSGETLAMLRHKGAAIEAVGFRHDLPDREGRIWRTESVLSHGSTGTVPLLRVRGQCIAAAGSARLTPPRRPHLLRALLDSGAGGQDGQIPTRAEVHQLGQDDASCVVGADIALGKASVRLPVIYVSATGHGRWIAEAAAFDRLALDVAGVAHVVLEPNRDFSFRLRDLAD